MRYPLHPPVEDFAEAFRSEQVLLITFERKKESLGDNTSFGLAKILTRDKKTARESPPHSFALPLPLPLSTQNQIWICQMTQRTIDVVLLILVSPHRKYASV